MVSPSKTTAFSGAPIRAKPGPEEVHVGRHGGHSAHGDEHEDNPAATAAFPTCVVVFFGGELWNGN